MSKAGKWDIAKLYSYFPLVTYPHIKPLSKATIKEPTLWILPPKYTNSFLSSDVECLKWQAYLALRGLRIALRWDVHPDGAIDGSLPNLHVPIATDESLKGRVPDDGDGELLAAHLIPTWVDGQVGDVGVLEGYKDQASVDESRAWVTLLEGHVHAALILHQPKPSLLKSLLLPDPAQPLQTILSPPPPPLSGLSSLIPPYGIRVSSSSIDNQYRDAMASLSERLGSDRWFLGSSNPTALDALLFAYLHCVSHSEDVMRIEFSKRVNLVAWEKNVRDQIEAAFRRTTSQNPV